jgi:hypothetical protein
MITGLAKYIRDDLYEEWKQDRQLLEVKWQSNLDNFNSPNKTTKVKVISAFALVIDMLLQGGQLPFGLKQSPWGRVMLDEMDDESRQAVEKAIGDQKALILQQLKDCFLDRQLAKGVMSGAMYGECYFDQYVHDVKRAFYQEQQMGGEVRYGQVSETHSAPAVEYVSVWDIFRDLSTDDLQEGIGLIRRRHTCAYDLRKKMDAPFFIKANIEKVIREAKGKDIPEDTNTLTPRLRTLKSQRNNIEELQFQGRVPVRFVEDFLSDSNNSVNGFTDLKSDGREVEILATMANDEIIRLVQRPPGQRTTYRVVWEDKLDYSEGTGVADNCADLHETIVEMWASYKKNMKLSSNVLLAAKDELLSKDWKKVLEEGGILETELDVDDINQVLKQFIIQNVGESIINGLRLSERYLDEASMLPKLLQGETAEKKAPDTAYEMNQLLQNAGKYLGQVIKNYDEGFIEPVITAFLDYNMSDPYQQKGKGNFIAEALGFTSFQDKVVRLQKIMQFLNLSLSNDALMAETKLRPIVEEIAKAHDQDPEQVLKTPDEKAQDQQNQMEMREMAKREAMQQMMAQAQIEETQKDNEYNRRVGEAEIKHEDEMELQAAKMQGEVALRAIQ